MSWDAVENALRAWAKLATSFPDARIFWAGQKNPRPLDPFCEMRLGPVRVLGAVDEIKVLQNLLRPQGTEMELQVRGRRDCTLALQVFGTVTGANSAHARAVALQTALSLPSTRAAFYAAGISVYDKGDIQTVPHLLDTEFESRAVLTVRFYTTELLSEYIGYIATVQIDGPGQSFLAP